MAYQKRQLVKGTDLETAKYVAKAGDKDVNARRTGRAIGAIGTEIGDAVDKFGKKKKPNKTNPNKLAEFVGAQKPPGFETPPFNYDFSGQPSTCLLYTSPSPRDS